MSLSLSVILPVRNVEQKLTSGVSDLLETIAELTGDFEVVIVDDGSSDDTEELTMELCRRFPQIRSLRNATRQGEIEAARIGIAKTFGEVVLIHDIETTLSGDVLRQFWAMRNDQELVYARSEPPHPRRVPKSHRPTSAAAWSGTQMLRREAVSELQATRPRSRIDRVTRTDLAAAESTPRAILTQLTASTRTIAPSAIPER